MADGLTLDDLDSLQHTSERFSNQPEWARVPLADIYRRHGIPASVSPADAAKMIEAGAENLGVGQSSWANPDERAAAREAYARQGSNPTDVKRRMEDSIYLLDPRTYEYMQKYGRDADFLTALDKQAEFRGASDAIEKAPTPEYDPTGIGDWRGMAKAVEAGYADSRRDAATGFWENSKDNPLYRSGVNNANYQRFGGIGQGVLNAVANPDTTAGNYMTFSETVPNFLRMQGSGETDTAGESWDAAQAARLAANRYRLTSPAPIADVATGASPQEISKRIAELRREVGIAAPPLAEERWQRTTGWTPPGFLADAGDFGISMLDPTFVLPAASIGKAANTAGKALRMGSKIAGTGWVAPAVRSTMAPVAGSLTNDIGMEIGVGAGIQAAAGGIGGRSWRQYAAGLGSPGDDFLYKNDAELAEAKEARRALRGRLTDDGSIEKAERRAYQNMRRDGVISQPPQFYWGMSPSGPAY